MVYVFVIIRCSFSLLLLSCFPSSLLCPPPPPSLPLFPPSLSPVPLLAIPSNLHPFHFSPDSDQPITYINPRKTSHSEKPTSRSLALSSFLPEDPEPRESLSKSTTLPSTRSRGQSSPKHFNRPPNLALPGYPYRPPSPILTSGGQVLGSDHHKHSSSHSASATSKSANTKRSLFRRRAESVDNPRSRH